MRIVYILSGSRLQDGSTKSFLLLLEGAIACGYECLVILPNKEGVYESLKDKCDVRIIKYRFNASDIKHCFIGNILSWCKWKRRQLINYIASFRLHKLCKIFNPDLIHSNSSIINIGYLVAKRMEIPHITHFREYGDLDFGKDIKNLSSQLRYKKNYSISITLSIANYRNLINNRCKIIYNGICGTDEFRYSDNKGKYILYAGRIQETKGIVDLVESYIDYFKEVQNPLDLYIAGDYLIPEGVGIKERINLLLERNQIGNSVKWLGDVDNISQFMYNAYVTVVPSFKEGFGRVMPEAIANGSLVIGRNTGGTKEQFDNGVKLSGKEIGLRFEDKISLTNLLVEVSNNGIQYYKSMIDTAQNVVRTLYSKESYVNEILNYYKTILNII